MIGFSEITGLKSTAALLTSAVERERVPNSLLLSGIDGGASLAFALSLAKLMACDTPEVDDACHKCPTCRQFDSFNYPDLHLSFPFSKSLSKSKDPSCLEYRSLFGAAIQESPYLTHNSWLDKLDVANQQIIIPVQEARSIIHDLSIKGFYNKPRFVLIWQPELLHKSAANKLLKSIEEPGDNTYFLLVSHKPDNVLGTIKSRCVRLLIPLNQEPEITEYISSNYDTSSNVAQSLSINAEGSIGYAVDAFKNKARHDLAAEHFIKWMRLLYANNVSEIVRWSEDMARSYREDIKFYLVFAAQIFRQSLLAKKEALSQSPFEHNGFNVLKFAPFIQTDKMDQIIELIEKCRYDIERNGNAKIILLDTSLSLSKYVGKA